MRSLNFIAIFSHTSSTHPSISKKKPTTRNGWWTFILLPTPDNSGCWPDNATILLQLIQQLASFPNGQVLRHIAVKPLVHKFLQINPLATRHSVDRLELIGGDRAATLRLRAMITLPLWKMFLHCSGGLNGTLTLLLP